MYDLGTIVSSGGRDSAHTVRRKIVPFQSVSSNTVNKRIVSKNDIIKYSTATKEQRFLPVSPKNLNDKSLNVLRKDKNSISCVDPSVV